VLADLVVDLLVADVEVDPQASLLQLLPTSSGIVVGVRGDGRDDNLDRREPQRHVAGIVLDEDAEEPLHRAADGAMDHHRHFFSPSEST
jgi:hypothetical protein